MDNEKNTYKNRRKYKTSKKISLYKYRYKLLIILGIIVCFVMGYYYFISEDRLSYIIVIEQRITDIEKENKYLRQEIELLNNDKIILSESNNFLQKENSLLHIHNNLLEQEITILIEDVNMITAEIKNTKNLLNNIAEEVEYEIIEDIDEYEIELQTNSLNNNKLEEIAITLIYVQNTVSKINSDAIDIEDYIEITQKTPSIYPTTGRITSYFGNRLSPYSNYYQFHTGVDIANNMNTEVKATAKGKVVFAGRRGTYGKLIIVDHDNGYQTYYAHLNSIVIEVGDSINQGQIIGYMGQTGRTTGTHLHYEVRYSGRPLNPIQYFK